MAPGPCLATMLTWAKGRGREREGEEGERGEEVMCWEQASR